MTPWDIERKVFHDVIVLFSKMRKLQMREEKTVKRQKQVADVIRRPAGDNWF